MVLAYIRTHLDCENSVCSELKEKFGLTGNIVDKGLVSCDGSFFELMKIGYALQTGLSIFLDWFSFPFASKESFDTDLTAQNINFPEWFETINKSNVLTWSVSIVSPFSKLDKFHLAKKVGNTLYDQLKSSGFNLKIDLKSPLLSFETYITENNCYIGLSFTPIDLGRREYKLVNTRESVNGSFAACVLYSCFSEPSELLSYYSFSGEFIIEALFRYLKKTPRYYDRDSYFPLYELFLSNEKINALFEEFDFDGQTDVNENIFVCYDPKIKHIINAQKNSAVAEVKEFISFYDGSFTHVIYSGNSLLALLPKASKTVSFQKTSDCYREFFESIKDKSYSSKVILSTPENSILIDILEYYKIPYSMKTFFQGKEELTAYIFE